MTAFAEGVVRDTRNWVERAVIGLNLCPFAKAVHLKRQVHYAVSAADERHQLLDDLALEIEALLALDASVRETTLLMAPNCLDDFLDFNHFMKQANRSIHKRGLKGVLQLASFHPAYQFADADDADDIANFTNRSPYPTIHLLREASVERTAQAQRSQTIYEANIQTMRRLGLQGWAALGVGPST
jgi:hypothetical protein